MGIKRVLYRLKQGINYIFYSYDENNNQEVKKILNEKEYKVFSCMNNYDKFHSYNLYKKILENDLLRDKEIYKKLALLHDCGKNNIGLIKRVKKILIGDKSLDNHTLISFEKIKNINLELANFCLIHHDITDDVFMSEFQKLDDSV